MAKRILTAVIWLPIAALGFAFAPVWGIALAISALSVCHQRSVCSTGAAVDVLQLGILSSAFGCIFVGVAVFLGRDATPGTGEI